MELRFSTELKKRLWLSCEQPQPVGRPVDEQRFGVVSRVETDRVEQECRPLELHAVHIDC